MKRFFEKWILRKFLRRVNDALPADGKKTIIGVAIVALGALASYLGGDSSVGSLVSYTINYLKSLEHLPAEQLGFVVTIIGLVGKWVKSRSKTEESLVDERKEAKEKLEALDKAITEASK